ncbi:MAG: DUF373 family protein [Candidatus ainarchaeum sp.]|nr:DUF373 family protein [Candidatus ainarchaeum sp.]
MKNKVLVVCVDRDNDLGRKTGISGPVIGVERNIDAATKLILADPAESDANTIFAAVKKIKDAKKHFKNIEIVTITGHGKDNLLSDKEINRQLDVIQKNFFIEGWILVTDGDEDNQVIPLLQSRGKIISTEQIIIKQAKAVESTFYTIKEVIKDPSVARTIFGIPGIVIVAYLLFGNISLQALSFIIGIYLFMKGFGIEEKIVNIFKVLIKSIKEQRVSVVVYTLALILPIIGVLLMFIQIRSSEFIDVSLDLISALKIIYPFIAFSGISLLVGKMIDGVYDKKAYKIGKYILQSCLLICIWLIIESATLVFLRQTTLSWFSLNIMISLIFLIVAINIAKIFNIQNKITKLYLDTLVLDEEGNVIGKIIEIDKKKEYLICKTEKEEIKIKRNEFLFKEGKIILINKN